MSETATATAPVEEQQATEDQAQEQPQAQTPTPPSWEVKRIAKLTRQAAEAERRAALAEARLQELATSVQQKTAQAEGDGAPTQTAGRGRSVPEAEFEIRVQAAVAERQFNETCNRIYTDGTNEFSDFTARLDTLKAAGAMVPEVVLAANEVGTPHKLLAALAEEPELAQRVAEMTPAKMVIELQRLSDRVNKPKAPSKAPPPAERIAPGGVASEDPEKMSVAEYVKWRKKQKAGTGA